MATTAATPADQPVPAPDFALTDLNGHEWRLVELRGAWVVLSFWATWCVPCRVELPALQDFAARHPEVIVLAINHREADSTVRAFALEHDLRMAIPLDPSSNLLAAYQVVGLPYTVLVDAAGSIAWRQFGPVALEALDAALGAGGEAGSRGCGAGTANGRG